MLTRKNVTYVIVEQNHTWMEALGKCLFLGGNLAVIDNLAEFTLMWNMLQEHRATGGRARTLWVDGANSQSQDAWYCATRGANCPFIQWTSGEPNAECACVWYTSAHSDGMSACTCTASDTHFPLCEFVRY